MWFWFFGSPFLFCDVRIFSVFCLSPPFCVCVSVFAPSLFSVFKNKQNPSAARGGGSCSVQASLLGSVFSNMLLVLGCCFFFGGLKHKEQHFNSTSAVANMSLLLLSSLALVLPTPLSHATVRR